MGIPYFSCNVTVYFFTPSKIDLNTLSPVRTEIKGFDDKKLNSIKICKKIANTRRKGATLN
jgi:hypothetical protein